MKCKHRGEVEVKLQPIRNLGARWGWVVSTTPQQLYPEKRPGTHCTGGLVGLGAGLDGHGKSLPHRVSIPGPSSPWRVATPATPSRPLIYISTALIFLCLTLL